MAKTFVWFSLVCFSLGYSASQLIRPTFAEAYNRWAELNRATRPNDTISAPELLAWQEVKSEWRKLEKQMDRHYRAEK